MYTLTQLNKAVAEAEERGRASVVATATPANPPTPTTPVAAAVSTVASEPTPEQKAAVAEIAKMRAEADDPNILARKLTAQVDKAKSEGRRIGLAQAAIELEKQGVI